MSQLQTVAKGLLGASILRNASKIKEERGIAVFKQLERCYKRKVEDLEYKLDRLQDERLAMLDMSPTNSQSLILAKEVDPDEFYRNHFDITMKIRTAKIELEEAREQYNSLFVTADAPVAEATEA